MPEDWNTQEDDKLKLRERIAELEWREKVWADRDTENCREIAALRELLRTTSDRLNQCRADAIGISERCDLGMARIKSKLEGKHEAE